MVLYFHNYSDNSVEVGKVAVPFSPKGFLKQKEDFQGQKEVVDVNCSSSAQTGESNVSGSVLGEAVSCTAPAPVLSTRAQQQLKKKEIKDEKALKQKLKLQEKQEQRLKNGAARNLGPKPEEVCG